MKVLNQGIMLRGDILASTKGRNQSLITNQLSEPLPSLGFPHQSLKVWETVSVSAA